MKEGVMVLLIIFPLIIAARLAVYAIILAIKLAVLLTVIVIRLVIVLIGLVIGLFAGMAAGSTWRAAHMIGFPHRSRVSRPKSRNRKAWDRYLARQAAKNA